MLILTALEKAINSENVRIRYCPIASTVRYVLLSVRRLQCERANYINVLHGLGAPCSGDRDAYLAQYTLVVAACQLGPTVSLHVATHIPSYGVRMYN